jgi:hypothetical protein
MALSERHAKQNAEGGTFFSAANPQRRPASVDGAFPGLTEAATASPRFFHSLSGLLFLPEIGNLSGWLA